VKRLLVSTQSSGALKAKLANQIDSAPQQELPMSAEYAAFEGYGDEDVQAEMGFYYVDEEDEDSWWTCFVPPWLK
jgi:hypothetical protein